MLKINKLNTGKPQIKHCLCPKYDIPSWFLQFTDHKKIVKKVTKNWNWLSLISHH